MLNQQFQIKGMHCVGCALTIDGALEDLPGVKAVTTSYAKQSFDVEYDPQKVSEAEIIVAIRHSGYDVKEKDIK